MTNVSKAARLTKWAAKLEAAETKLIEATDNYNTVVAEINAVLGNGTTTQRTAAKTTRTAPKSSHGTTPLGDRIVEFLRDNPGGWDLKDLAKQMKVNTQKVGVSASHLIRKGLAYFADNKYFAASAVAAKSITLDEGTSGD